MDYFKLNNGKQYIPGIYFIKSKCGKIYIGSAVSLRGRFMCHRNNLIFRNHDNSRLQNYYNKHGNDSLEFFVLENCDRKDLIEREQFYIDMLNPFFNICRIAGATYGLKPWLGKRHSEETKAKIKATNLRTFANRPKKEKPIKLTRQQNTERFANLNKSSAARLRISLFQRGNTHWLGKKHKQETIVNRTGALNGNAKKIICNETNQLFTYGKEAALFLNVSKSLITRSLKTGHKINGQYSFKYAS